MTDNNNISDSPAFFDRFGSLLNRNLRRMMLLCLIGLVILLLVSIFPAVAGVTQWLTLLLSGCTIWTLFQLTAVSERYRKAAIFHCVILAGNLFNTVTGVGILTLVISICSIVAQYQEFHGHAEVCQEKEPSLTRKWERLFWWEMGVGLVGGFLMSAGVVIGVLVNTDAELLTTVMLLLNTLLSVGIGLVYLNMLKKTAALYCADTE